MNGPFDLRPLPIEHLHAVHVEHVDAQYTFLVNGDGRVLATVIPEAWPFAQFIAAAINTALNREATP